MPTCSFCKRHYDFPRGLTLFLNDGRTMFFCSSKCRKNHALGRDSKRVKWVIKSKKGLAEDVSIKKAQILEESQKKVVLAEKDKK